MTQNLLSEYRKRANLTQKQVGDHIGISSQAVSKWETGQSEPDIDTLYKLAQLYGTTVDELVGRAPQEEKEEATASSEKKPSPFLEAVKKYKKILILAAVGLLVALVAVILCVTILSATEEERMFEKFEMIELGMTMDEVEEILGEAEETGDTSLAILTRIAIEEYGYAEADFWYYRGKEYDKNMDKIESLDLDYEFEPYDQIRIAFNDDGEVIEAYFHANMLESLMSDYGVGEDKEIDSIQYFDKSDKVTAKPEQAVTAKICFTDGSVYLGKIDVDTNAVGDEVTVKHPWGTETMENE